jgi:hypothetical protein
MFYDFDWPEHHRYVDDIKRVCYDLESKRDVSGVAPDASELTTAIETALAA